MLDVPFVARLIRVTLTVSPFPAIERAIPLLLGLVCRRADFQRAQLGGGPAKGYWGCEEATKFHIWTNYLAYQPTIRDWFMTRCGMTGPDVEALEHNLVYQILMARTHYLRLAP